MLLLLLLLFEGGHRSHMIWGQLVTYTAEQLFKDIAISIKE